MCLCCINKLFFEKKIKQQKKMKFLRFLTMISSFFLSSLSQDPPEQQQQQINREAIEAILNLVSPPCRSEMEIAIETQSDVSLDCREEIQKAVQIISGYQQQHQQQQQQDNYGNEGDSQSTESSDTTKVTPKHTIHPGFWIAGFVLVLIGGATAYIIHVNKLLQEAFPEKSHKKLSKKKVHFSNLLLLLL